MALKKTNLLHDEPSSKDELGGHSNIAELIKGEIFDSHEGRSIAIIGEWGSGKSTVINLLEEKLQKNKGTRSPHVFVYDAWAHQGDSLRRAFLDDFVSFLDAEGLLDDKQVQKESERIWNRVETTTTTTEPILRPHAKLLFIGLAIYPLGLKFFDVHVAQNARYWMLPNFTPIDQSTNLWTSLLTIPNIIGLILMLAPFGMLFVFSLINSFGPSRFRNYLFNINDEQSNFSVLSFFFEKVQGTKERKHIKSPVDSIIEFKNIFNEMIDDVVKNKPDSRIVIIIDNIDRVSADQARDFWSTMQTFFNENGGTKKKKGHKYWLIAPFSTSALSAIFEENPPSSRDGIEQIADEKVDAYIDKIFGLSFFVPPPIMSNWRKYLLNHLHTAFPEHDAKSLVRVRDIFDFIGSENKTNITPRNIKLFINSLVVLYRQRDDDISLATIAAFLLSRKQIIKAEFGKIELSPIVISLLDTPDWLGQFAAIYHGVSVEIATQLLLNRPITDALRNNNAEDLRRVEARPGFVDVLQNVVRVELEIDAQKNSGVSLTNFASTISALDAANELSVSGLWEDLGNHLKMATDWSGMQSPVEAGLKAILSHADDVKRNEICRFVALSLSKTEVPQPKNDFNSNDQATQHWLDAALTILRTTTEPNILKLTPSGSPQFKLELIEQISELNLSSDVLSVRRQINMDT